MSDSGKAHWAWPHAIGVIVAIAVYFVVYRYTGDSDLFLAVATGAGGVALTWAYLRFLGSWRPKREPRS